MTACVRSAWLKLGSLTVLLEDPSHGYFCQKLDLGYPTVREVSNNRPDGNGADDRTQYFGPRVVSADITALVGAGAQIDTIADLFAPFMTPNTRPELHYVLDRPGAPASERVLTVRASAFSAPIVGANQRDLQLQFVASDPAALDATVKIAIAYSGTPTTPGRLYNLVYPRTYPVGSSGPVSANILPGGVLPIRPHLRVYGPIQATASPLITLAPVYGADGPAHYLIFPPPFQIADGYYVDIDTDLKTAYLSNGNNLSGSLDWQHSTWPVIYPVPPAQGPWTMQLNGTATSVITQVQATWQDRYLT
jgi:hypothetical protein